MYSIIPQRQSLLYCFIGFVLFFGLISSASATTTWRVSIKVLLESDGSTPDSPFLDAYGNPIAVNRGQTLTKLIDSIDGGNEVLTRTGRPIRLDLLEVIELRRLSTWNSSVNTCADLDNLLDQEARQNPERYAFRDDAINVYYFRCAGPNSGTGHFPWRGRIIVLRPTIGRLTLMHEVGHHHGLMHTFAGISSSVVAKCDDLYPPSFNRLNLAPGEDNVFDTLPDHPCWRIDEMSNFFYRANYDRLPSGKQLRVMNTFANLMSKHPIMSDRIETNYRRLTPAQMVRAEYYANTSSASEVGFEEYRDIQVDPDISAAAKSTLKRTFGGEFVGTWNAIGGDMTWLNQITITSASYGRVIYADVPNADRPLLGLRLYHNLYGDTMIGVAPPNESRLYNYTFGTTTYNLKLTDDNLLVVRVNSWTNGSSNPFLQRTIYFTR